MEEATLMAGTMVLSRHQPNPWRPLTVKLSRNQVQSKTHAVPELRFEDQKLTSFAGLFVFQLLFQRLDLKNRLRIAGMYGWYKAKRIKEAILGNHQPLAEAMPAAAGG